VAWPPDRLGGGGLTVSVELYGGGDAFALAGVAQDARCAFAEQEYFQAAGVARAADGAGGALAGCTLCHTRVREYWPPARGAGYSDHEGDLMAFAQYGEVSPRRSCGVCARECYDLARHRHARDPAQDQDGEEVGLLAPPKIKKLLKSF